VCCSAWTQEAGALAISMSAVRAPCAASDWYFVKVWLSPRSVYSTLMPGYCFPNASMTGWK
jgi:hypothetical protein